METVEFVEFAKIARLNREAIVTEKIDGTNAQVLVNDTGTDLMAGSRNKWITPTDDNFGFASWVEKNKTELLRLGPGSHFGEWWGAGIGRRYDMKEKKFSLFNVSRWGVAETRPKCCDVVPTLWRGSMFELFEQFNGVVEKLRTGGSVAAPGFMKPEGVVVFHVASGDLYKYTLDLDGVPKSKVI